MSPIATEDNIFVKPIIEEGGRVHIPPVFQRKAQPAMKGITIFCGPDAIVKEGETIIFHKWQDNTIQWNGDDLLIIKPHSIVAIK